MVMTLSLAYRSLVFDVRAEGKFSSAVPDAFSDSEKHIFRWNFLTRYMRFMSSELPV